MKWIETALIFFKRPLYRLWGLKPLEYHTSHLLLHTAEAHPPFMDINSFQKKLRIRLKQASPDDRFVYYSPGHMILLVKLPTGE